MTKLIENIIKYYIETIMEEHGVAREHATHLLEEAMQDSDIENEIMDRIAIYKDEE